MAVALQNLDRTPTAMRRPLETYARLVHELLRDHGRSLTLFGPVLGGEFDARRDSVRSVVVLEPVNLDLLRRLAEHGGEIGRLGIAAPLVLTPQHVRSSLDTFPLELIEIAQLHVTLWGEDPFSDLAFADPDVRLQCEREAKRLLIGLRQGLLATAGRERLVPSLEHEAAEVILRILRGLLWLRGHKAFAPTKAVVTRVEEIAGRRLAGLQAALDRSARPGWSDFDALYGDIEAIGELVRG